ncbi:MAG: 16S rRNA (adenine(1518)-N(6)/adenine(1519)-N(6))-dimethyltransferase RsmA [Nitrospiria bacterium]
MKKTSPRFVRPRKSWGQHFLIDANIQRKILDAAEIQPEEHVIEIGPGLGILTKGLLERGARVTAIEVDPILVDRIRKEITTTEPPRLDLITGDALRYPYQEIQGPYKVVANLPYYLSTPLLFRLLEGHRRIRRMVLMVQKEVADRLAAAVGTKSYGALSIAVQYYADIQVAFTVPPSCFRPRPKIDSTVIVITPLLKGRVPVRNEPLFLRVVRGAFGYRRKRVANALDEAGFSREIVASVLDRINIDPSRRGETLTMAEFAALADALFDSKADL